MKSIEEIRNYCLNCINKPCSKNGCPLNNDIPSFIHEEDTKKAFDILCKTTVLPAICGRVCPHSKQCQGSCIRGIKGKPVQIGKAEAHLGDVSIEKNFKIPKEHINNLLKEGNYNVTEEIQSEAQKKIEKAKVAVIGSGPAGLTCAAFLAKYGVKVTIYEKYDKLGGLLRHGIPDFRLDRQIVEQSIKKILDLGVVAKTEKELGKDISLKDLSEKYDAVFLSIGANISNETLTGKNVLNGNEFLERINLIQEEYTVKLNEIGELSNTKNSDSEFVSLINNLKEKNVAISGGGNVAMDCARTLKRLGANVTVVYRRDEEQMPAEKYEIEDAKHEGINFCLKTNIKSFDSRTSSMNCVKTELIKIEGDDRLSPREIEGSNFELKMDYLVLAIGSKTDRELLEKEGLELTESGYVKVNSKMETSINNIYAGGDVAGTKATVAFASRAGREAAQNIILKMINS